MTTKACLGILAGLGTMALSPRLGSACGALPTPYVTLTDGLPAARTGLPRDGAVIIRGKLWAPGGGPFAFAELHMLDEAGNRIPTADVNWYSATPSLAIHPASPLPAHSRISVEAVVPEGAPRPDGAVGPLAMRLTFETGDEVAPPLVLAGPLRVTLERFDADDMMCTGQDNCSSVPACTKLGTRRALRARVVVPAASGGVDFDGYRGWLDFTGDRPATFEGGGEGRTQGASNIHLPSWLDVRAGAQTEVFQEILDEDAPYAPCFALNVWDPAGHAVQAQPVCLPSIKASDYVRALDAADGAGGASAAGGQGGGGLAAGGSGPAAEGPGGPLAGGCSTAPAGGRGGAGLLAMVLAVLAVRRRRG
jgi:MYXO-CTERM domain-containing protein